MAAAVQNCAKSLVEHDHTRSIASLPTAPTNNASTNGNHRRKPANGSISDKAKRKLESPPAANLSNYVSLSSSTKFDLEPNPFEQSFAAGECSSVSTRSREGDASKEILPPIASITSPSGAGLQGMQDAFGWGSLRHGPLSPAMLPAPTPGGSFVGAFDSALLRSGLTPNESGIRTGLTPGGMGTPGNGGASMFPVPSPTTAALLGFGATPGTLGGGTSALSRHAGTATSSVANGAPSSYDQRPSNKTLPSTAPPHTHLQRQTVRQQPNHVYGATYDQASAAANGLFLLSQHAPHTAVTSASEEGADVKSNQGAATRSLARRKKGDMNVDRRQARGGRRKDEDGKTTVSSIKRNHIVSTLESDEVYHAVAKRTKKEGLLETEEDKRRNFLERNRQAALKCRQRKKQWLSNLQAKVDYFAHENETMNSELSELRNEIVQLKSILQSHRDCPAIRSQLQAGGLLELISRDLESVGMINRQDGQKFAALDTAVRHNDTHQMQTPVTQAQ